VEELQLQLQLSETLENGLHDGLQAFGEILKQKKKFEEHYRLQLQQKTSENKRPLLNLHQREAQLY
jgi:hypothetical protein